MATITISIEQLLISIDKLGIQLSLAGDQLKLQAENAKVVTNDLRQMIRERKEELICYLKGENTQPPIMRRSISTPPPLSFAQQRLWFLDQLEPASTLYNIPLLLRLTGQLNVAALEASFRYLIARHESLRTVFGRDASTTGEPFQIIHPPTWATHFTLSVTSVADEAEARRLAQAETIKPFNLSQGSLLRAQLFQFAADDASTNSAQYALLVVTMHHIISDGWSRGVFVQELSHAYGAYVADNQPILPDLPIQYADFAVWQREYLSGERLARQLTYWREQLADAPALLELPTDRPRPAVQSNRGAHHEFQLDAALTAQLDQLAQAHNATLFMLLLTAFNVLLARYSRQEDILVGTPIANRNRTEIEGLIGCFVNTLVLRTRLEGNLTFSDVLAQVRQTTLDAYQHQELPFEHLVEELNVTRTLSYSPLFQVMLVLQNANSGQVTLPGLTTTVQPVDFPFAKFDLTLNLMEHAGGLLGVFEYATDLFDEATIARLTSHFTVLLQGIVANPEQPIQHLPLLTATEYHQIVHEWNDTAVDFGTPQTIHALFEQQVARTPEAVAVVSPKSQVPTPLTSDTLTYAELNARANQLAHHLIALGVEPDTLVAVAMERSIEMVVSLLAVLKAGGAYVPIDPTYPSERIRYMLSDSAAPVLLTQSYLPLAQWAVAADAQHSTHIVAVDDRNAAWTGQSTRNPQTATTPLDLAYVIYTSGSTGQPKGIAITQQNVANFLAAMQRKPGLGSQDRLLAVTTISFDIAVLELYLPLAIGASIVIASEAQTTDPLALLDLLRQYQITVMQATPATWTMLTAAAGWKTTAPLKVLCGGEALPIRLAEQLLAHSSSVWNLYGPTETTVWVSAGQLASGLRRVTLAQPIANTQFYILDNYGALVPVGVNGELYVGGAQLARGYLNRAQLTTERFIQHPAFGRLYKTGDLCRWLPDGTIEYIGRSDFQVKIRGFRIELSEIENALLSQPGVREAVVLVREDTPGDKRLVAYLVQGTAGKEQGAGKDAATDNLPPETLRQALAHRLPDYMIPAAFVTLDALPLTPNGKLDRRALPAPDYANTQSEFVAPRNNVEQHLAAIWQEVLSLERVGVYDNFFVLGGHSLLATQVISRIRSQLKIELPLKEFFQAKNLEELAVLLTTAIPSVNRNVQTKARVRGVL